MGDGFEQIVSNAKFEVEEAVSQKRPSVIDRQVRKSRVSISQANLPLQTSPTVTKIERKSLKNGFEEKPRPSFKD